MSTLIPYVLAIVIVVTAVLMFRSTWVLRTRVWMIATDFEQYKRMPGYLHMLFRPWIWTAHGFGWQ